MILTFFVPVSYHLSEEMLHFSEYSMVHYLIGMISGWIFLWILFTNDFLKGFHYWVFTTSLAKSDLPTFVYWHSVLSVSSQSLILICVM